AQSKLNYCTFESCRFVPEPRLTHSGYTQSDFCRDAPMPKKKKKKPFRAVTAVKELARERVGSPPSEKIVVEKKKKPERHKPTLSKLLGDTDS
ncbi:MAG: hypothetical protein WA485_17675, partial [Candidatus Sulfotelmatobacter sp.]